jgi:methionyl-tRNA formyltransferase
MDRLKLVFAGSGEFGVPTLKSLREAGHEIVQVISQPDRPAGRGRSLTPTPIASLATEMGLPVLKTANINAESLPPADLMIVIAFGQKIAPPIVEHPRLGSVNLHASILPKYRGAAPINWAIIRGETVAGNSVIRLAERMDAGAVLGQSSLPIGELETAGELHDRLAQDGAALVLKVADELSRGVAREQPQDESQVTLAPKLSRDASKIDWRRPASEIANQIRGMFPWPGCRMRLIDPSGAELARVTLVRARASSGTGQPGEIGSEGRIGTAAATVEVVELQPEGKRPMALVAFRNGHPWQQGMRLESIVN